MKDYGAVRKPTSRRNPTKKVPMEERRGGRTYTGEIRITIKKENSARIYGLGRKKGKGK